jgi:hypothetical protein
MTVTQTPAVAQPSPPAAPRPRTWLREIIPSGQIVETCPKFCTSSHLTDQRGMLDDLIHGADEVSLVFPGMDESMAILSARVQVDPYSTDPCRNVPHVLFEPSRDEPMGPLDPEQYLAVLDSVQAHLDRLREQVLAQLVAARAEYGVTVTA